MAQDHVNFNQQDNMPAILSQIADSIASILSSHSGVSEPSYVVTGLIWYNTDTGVPMIYNGTSSVSLTSAISGSLMTPYSVVFFGAVSETVAGDERVIRAPFDCTVKAGQVHHADQNSATAGETTFRISDYGVSGNGGAENKIDVTLEDESTLTTERVTAGEFDVDAGDPIYIFCQDSAGGHANGQVHIEIIPR